jgi:actin related protein 2/3 complex subunit 1A/1B
MSTAVFLSLLLTITVLAICPNNNEIHIYETKSWTRLHVLGEHDLLVQSIDWSAVTNKIVSCSHDRNAFVWTYEDASATWKPALVILRIDRAALDVKWSWDGLRFAVTSGAKCVPVCSYEHANDW